MKNLVFSITLVVLLVSCNEADAQYTESEAASQLRKRLETIAQKGIMFGHQDTLAYGVGWGIGTEGESDVKRTAGDYPAVFGWDIGNIGRVNNLDRVPFASIKTYIQRVHAKGGINTISWHARNPVTGGNSWDVNGVNIPSLLEGGENNHLLKTKLDLVAQFFFQLTDSNGELIPIIFRPWHEMDGPWFWWGTSNCTPDQYIALFRYTVDYLRHEKGLDNLLIAFSPGRYFETANKYLERYPGDDYVDILGVDNYGDFIDGRLDLVVNKLSIIVDLAITKNKIAAFTESGSYELSINNWYTSNLLHVLKANDKTRSIAYVLVWRNRDGDRFFVPYPEHPQADDFRAFTNDDLILLLNDINKPVINGTTLPAAVVDVPYSVSLLEGLVTDLNPGDVLTFTDVSSPEWMTIATNGIITGTPDRAARLASPQSVEIHVADQGGLWTQDVFSVEITGLLKSQLDFSDDFESYAEGNLPHETTGWTTVSPADGVVVATNYSAHYSGSYPLPGSARTKVLSTAGTVAQNF